MKRALLSVAPVLMAVACATLGSPGEGDVDLPSSGVGPFRKLGGTEVLGVAPFVLEDKVAHYRDPTVVAQDADASSSRVILFAVAQKVDPGNIRDVIVRTRADDARSFFGTSSDLGHEPRVVLEASLAWEGGHVAQPSVIRVGDELFLYYAGDGGIGVARSSDGFTFKKQDAPVLVRDPSVAWETTTPSAPSVARYPDGSFRMLYAAGLAIGEASSSDGIAWTRVDADPSTPAIDPVLEPSIAPPPESLQPGEKPPFDTAQIGDPCLSPRVTPAGRLQVRVLYTGYDAAPGVAGRNGTIGFAARYGTTGRLERQASPIYSVAKHEAAPALFEWQGGSMLYVHQDKTIDSQTIVPAVAAAFAPPTLTLATPTGYAEDP